MKKGRIWIIIIAIIAILVLWFVKLNNRMVAAEEKAVQAWSQVENVYQRRSDLIPNLVAIVKGAADFERGTLEAVIEARAKATSVTVDPSNLTEESMAAFQ
ncbi:MAG: LemA family protein, partial [Bacteroidales bacterium]